MVLSQGELKTLRDVIYGAGILNKDLDYIRCDVNGQIVRCTYGQFAEYCKLIEAYTMALNNFYGRKVHVALLGKCSLSYLTAMFGVICGGGVSIPLDAQLNSDAVLDHVKQADTDVIFYDADKYEIIKNIQPSMPDNTLYFCLQDSISPSIGFLMNSYVGYPANSDVVESDPAVIMFTSGSTGVSKGVVLSNSNLVDSIFNKPVPLQEIILNILPINHAFCLNADFLLNFRNASVTCLNDDITLLEKHLLLFEPTKLHIVPMIAQGLYTKLSLLSKQTGKPLSELKPQLFGRNLCRIITGGAHLPSELIEQYKEINILICQGYGLTECSPTIASPDVTRPDKSGTAGRIVKNCQVRISSAGELQVKSPAVMLGYYKDPEKTAEAITADGWLRTGDLGYVDDENFLHITGRIKNLIILSNGVNVSPEELEDFLYSEKIISECLVYGVDSTIVAEIYTNPEYISLNNITDVNATMNEIIAKINAPLPSYKKIMRFILRDTPFEKTASGKLIRGEINLKENSYYKMPENELQLNIYRCISDILGHNDFGVDTNIFEVGMDSICCIMFLAALSETFGISIELEELMNNPTVILLAKFCDKQDKHSDIDYTPRSVYPLTNLQKYFVYVLRDNTTANLPFLFELNEDVSISRLHTSLLTLFSLHPILNNVIQPVNGVYVNLRDDNRLVNIPIIKTTEADWQIMKNNLLVPYMYTEGEALYHISLYETEASQYMYFDIAHIIGDGASINVLLEDLANIYNGFNVSPESYTYYDYILEEKYHEEHNMRQSNEEYFENLMKDMRIHKTILNRKNSNNLSHGINASLNDRFNKLNKSDVMDICKQCGISENVLFLSAFSYCISLFSNEDDTIFTSIHNGRTDSRWNHVVGPLFVTYNFRHTFDANETIDNLLSSSSKQILKTMCCHINNLHADEMFIQYQGDILNFSAFDDLIEQRIHLNLDSLPFHFMIMSNEYGYSYELRYWENRFEETQLKVFIDAFEATIMAMKTSEYVNQIKFNMPSEIIPDTCLIDSGDSRIEVCVIDSDNNKKPYGAWGILCTINTDGSYKETEITARILPDNSIDFLENSGRLIMSEGLHGRNFLDLGKLEKVIKDYPDVTDAKAYVSYSKNNRLILVANVEGNDNINKELLTYYVGSACDSKLIPSQIDIVKK